MKDDHKVVALLPFDVSISTVRIPKGVDLNMLKEMEKDEGYTSQSLFYSQFLKKSGNFTCTFQDISETNALLERNNLDYETLRVTPKAEVARILGVDAVISGIIQREKPMSEAAAIATGVLLGIQGPTNKINVDMTIHDGKSGGLAWKYTHQLSGNLGTSSDSLIKAFTRKVARKFPYNRT